MGPLKSTVVQLCSLCRTSGSPWIFPFYTNIQKQEVCTLNILACIKWLYKNVSSFLSKPFGLLYFSSSFLSREARLRWHNLAWTCFDFFFFLSCTPLFLSFSHCKDIPDCCSGSPTPSSSSSIYFSISPGAAGSCASIDSVGINKRLLLSDLKKKNNPEVCILYDAVSLFSHSTCCMFMILNWIIVEKEDHVFFYFCHSYIFFLFFTMIVFLCVLLIWSSINWGAMYYFWLFFACRDAIPDNNSSQSRATCSIMKPCNISFHSKHPPPPPPSVILARCTCSEHLF